MGFCWQHDQGELNAALRPHIGIGACVVGGGVIPEGKEVNKPNPCPESLPKDKSTE